VYQWHSTVILGHTIVNIRVSICRLCRLQPGLDLGLDLGPHALSTAQAPEHDCTWSADSDGGEPRGNQRNSERERR
jgi:hypothetical protein